MKILRPRVLLVCISIGLGSAQGNAQLSPSILYQFSSSRPNSLLQAEDGNFYGTTLTGGDSLGQGKCFDGNGSDVGCGSVFALSPSGSIYILYSFCPSTVCTDGFWPNGLIQGGDGNLYGTSTFGGSSIGTGYCVDGQGNDLGCGTIFRVTFSGSFSLVHSFSGAAADGAFPNPLVMGSNGMFYGTALSCSNDDSTSPCSSVFSYGSLFSFDPTHNAFEGLFSFEQSKLAYPNSLIQGSDGNLYGTTQLGGNIDSNTGCLVVNSSVPAFGCGGVFEYITANKQEKDLYFFSLGPASVNQNVKRNVIIRQPGRGFPGGSPWTFENAPISLVQGEDGSLFGTTPPACVVSGYAYLVEPPVSCAGAISTVESKVFQFIPSTEGLNVLQTFTGDPSASDGGGSNAGLFLATDNNYYALSGPYVFQASSFSTPYAAFTSGYLPNLLIQANDGEFYGTAVRGDGSGAVFKIADSSSLAAPVRLALSPLQISLGNSVTASWNVANAFSTTAQQCYGYIQAPISGAGSFTGLLSGTVANGSYGGKVIITPTQAGTYTYAVTCGGNQSAFSSLTVSTARPPSVSANPNTITIASPGGTGSSTLTLSNFSSAMLSVSCAALPAKSVCSLTGVSATSATLVITTTAPSAAFVQYHGNGRFLVAVIFLPALVWPLAGKWRIRLNTVVMLLSVILLSAVLPSCGGSSSTSTSSLGTPPGQSSVTVTITAGTQSASVPITLVVE